MSGLNPFDELLEDQQPEEGPQQPAAPTNPFLELNRQLESGREASLRSAITKADETTPDRAAEVARLSTASGIAPAIVERNFDAVKKTAALENTPFRQIMAQTPALAEWVSDPAKAAVVKDDMEQLGAIEWLLTAPGRAFAQGMSQIDLAKLRTASLTRDLTREELDRLDVAKHLMKDGGALGVGDSWFRGAVTGAAGQMPIYFGAALKGAERAIPAGVTLGTMGALAGGGVGSIPAAALTFGAGATAGMMAGGAEFGFELEAGLALDEYLDMKDELGRPMDPAAAKGAAIAVGALNGGLEAVGLGIMARTLGKFLGVDRLTASVLRPTVKAALQSPTVRAALAEAGKTYAEGLVGETAVEVAQRAVTILAGEAAKATGKSGSVPGMLEPGNVDLYKQPVVQNADGSTSTVDSFSVNLEGKEVLLPTVTPDGRHLSQDDALAEYKKTGKNLGTFDSPESATKFAEQLHNDYAAGVYSSGAKMKSAGAIVSDLANEAAGALQSFALMMLPGPVMHVAAQTHQAAQASKNVAFFKALGSSVKDSKTLERMPQALQDFIGKATKDGPLEKVYAPLDTFTTYWQSKGLDPAEVAEELTGSTTAYENAIQTGEDIEIPTAAYAVKVAGTEHNSYFAEELRLAPGAMNAREAKEFVAEQEAIAAEEAARAAGPGPSETEQIRTHITQQLLAAGVEPGTATNYAALMESSFASLAERSGVDPVALYRQYGLTVARPDMGPATAQATQAAPAAAATTEETAAPVAAQEAATAPVEPVAAAAAPEAGTQPAVARSPNRAPEIQNEIGMRDSAGREIGGTSPIYEGPERRGADRGLAARELNGDDRINAMADPIAAAIRMRAENPRIDEQAQAMRDQATAAGRIPAPPRSAKSAPVLDKKSEAADTEESQDAETEQGPNRVADQGRSPTGNRVQASDPGNGKNAGAKADKHLARVFGSVLAAARELDPNVDEAELKKEFDFRVAFYLEQRDAYNEAGHDPTELLRTIAKLGGLYEPDDGMGAHGELARLGAGSSFGSFGGVSGVFAKPRAARTGGGMAKVGYRTVTKADGTVVKVKVKQSGAGVKARGHGLDVMLQMLQDDPKFAWIENVDMLLDQIDEAGRHKADVVDTALPGTEELRDVGIRREAQWWAGGWHSADMLEDVDESLIENAVGDTSFDVTEFNQGLFDEFEALKPDTGADTLTTGEQQPRLPGAEQVREQENATPQLTEAPFALTSEVTKRKAKQTTLFQSGQVFAEDVRAWAEDIKTLAGEDLREFAVNLTRDGDLHLDMLVVSRGAQRAGLGSKVMREFTRFADRNGLRATVTPGIVLGAGTTSRDRLVDYYKRFGFVENSGRHADHRTSAGMLREPTATAFFQSDAKGPVTETPQFKAWFGESLVVDEEGAPLVVYHGTTGNFDTFDRGRGNIESDFGAGIYFSNTSSDVGANYAGMGPDLKSKVERLAEQIQDRYADNDGQADDDPGPTVSHVVELLEAKGLTLETATADDRFEAFRAIAAEELGVEHGGATVPVYLKMEKPAIVGGRGETLLTIDREYAPLSDFQEEDIEELREQGLDDDEIRRELSERNYYDPEESGTLLSFIEELRHVASHFDGGEVDQVIGEILEQSGGEGMGISEVLKILKNDEHFGYFTDENGNVASNEIIRQAIERAGFDGIIDRTVDQKFGSQRRLGMPMAGVDPDTVHYIVFEPTQIKSAIGNRGTFNPHNPSILEQGDGDPGGSGPKRGVIRFGADRQFSIDLLERADLSTVLHEFGHFYLEVFGDIADRLRDVGEPNAMQRQALADYDAILKWVGVENRGALTDKEHEQFARGFEAYLLEGNAPSPELRASFARFRAWLLGIYRTVKNLRVNLTDDVRRVFDRMVATDEAIARAEQEASVTPMFLTAADAGMSASEFEVYGKDVSAASRAAREKLEVQVLAEVQREQQAAWKAQRLEMHDKVAAETHAMPVYQALAAMQHGTNPDGSPLVEGLDTPPLKLSRQMIVDQFGKDRLKRLPARPSLFTRDGGMDPSAVARMYGFASADEMLQAIEQAEPMKARIERETSRRMIEENGSMLLDGTLQEKAQAAVGNEERENIIRAELRALSMRRRLVEPFVKEGQKRAVGDALAERAYERRWFEAEAKLRIAIAEGHKQVEIDALRAQISELKAKARGSAVTVNAALPPADALRQAAKARIAKMQVRELRPEIFWNAARAAGKKAFEAHGRQEIEAAIVAKQQELFNLALFREATRVKAEIEKRVERAQGMGTTAARQRLGLAGDSYLEQVDEILGRYEFAAVSGKALDKRGALRQWVAAMQAQGLPVSIPDEVIDDARHINYRELTVEELVGVTDALDHILHLARLKNKLLKSAAGRSYSDTRDALVRSILEHNTEHAMPLETRPEDAKWSTFADIFASHLKIAAIARVMDGGLDGGKMWETFIRPLNEAADDERVRMEAATLALHKTFTDHYTRKELGRFSDQMKIDAIGGSLSKEARLAVALYWGTATGQERLLNDPTRKWNRVQVQAILDTLDERDWKFVQAKWATIGSYWPEIAAQQKRLTGLEPPKVDGVEFSTKFGTVQGAYYPIVYDSGRIARAKEIEMTAQIGAAARQATARGHVEARKQSTKLSLRLDLMAGQGHLEQVIHDLTHHDVVSDLARLLRDGELSAAFYNTRGKEVHRQFISSLTAIAQGNAPLTGADRAFRFVRGKTTLALLGLNVWTSLQQPLGMFNGAQRVGSKWVAKGLAKWLKDGATMQGTLGWIHSVSPFMRERKGGVISPEMADLRKSLGIEGGWADTMIRTATLGKIGKQEVLGAFMWHIGRMQRFADVPTWLGGYLKAMDGGADEKTAIALADQAVLDSQGGGDVKDLAAVQRGPEALKAFLLFYSYGNMVMNSTYVAGATAKKSPAGVARVLSDVSLLYILPAMGTVALGYALGKKEPDEDDTFFDFMVEVGRESVSSAMNGVLLLRELAAFAREGNRGYSGPAGTRLIQLMYRVKQQAEQGEFDEAAFKAVAETAGVLFGLPIAQLEKTIAGFLALEEGKTSNPGVLLVGPDNDKK